MLSLIAAHSPGLDAELSHQLPELPSSPFVLIFFISWAHSLLHL